MREIPQRQTPLAPTSGTFLLLPPPSLESYHLQRRESRCNHAHPTSVPYKTHTTCFPPYNSVNCFSSTRIGTCCQRGNTYSAATLALPKPNTKPAQIGRFASVALSSNLKFKVRTRRSHYWKYIFIFYVPKKCVFKLRIYFIRQMKGTARLVLPKRTRTSLIQPHHHDCSE